MKYDPHNNRPGDLLDECQAKYGLADRRHITTHTMVYYRKCSFDDQLDEWVASWHIGGATKESDKALVDTFREIMPQLAADATECRGRNATHFDALVTVVSGEGRFEPRTEDGRDFDSMTAEERQAVAEFLGEAEWKPTPRVGVPTRIVSIISLEGMASEITIFPADEEPSVSRIEQWVKDEDSPAPHTSGPIEEAMLSMFGFIQLLRQTIDAGRQLSMTGVLETAQEIDREHGSSYLTGEILSMIGSGMKAGLFSFDDDGHLDFADDDE